MQIKGIGFTDWLLPYGADSGWGGGISACTFSGDGGITAPTFSRTHLDKTIIQLVVTTLGSDGDRA